MSNTFKKFLIVALFGAAALGAFGQMTLNGGHISSVAVAHASTLSCSVGTAMFDNVSDSNPQVGETITYTLEGATAFNASTTVQVTDALGADLTFVSANPSVGTYSSSTGIWSLGTLNGTPIVTLTLTAKVNAGAEGQTIDNAPTVQYIQSGCTQSDAVNDVSITVQGSGVSTPTSTPTSTVSYADLSISKTADVTSTIEGGTVNYTVAVTDNGPATSTGVVATDLLPSGLTLVSATASEGSYASSTGTWTIGNVNASSTATLHIAATANSGTAGSTITNTATVSENASTTDPNTANNSSSVSVGVLAKVTPCSLSAAQFYADMSNGTIKVGSVLINNASGTASFSVVNRTQCTAPISLASYKMFVAPGASQWLSTQQLFDSTSSPAIPANATTTFVVNIAPCMTQVDGYFGQAPAHLLDSNPYSYPNVPFVLAWAFSNGALCSAPTAPSADLSVSKTADVTSTNEGATVHYTITVTDLGPATSTGVVATDTLPAGLTFVSATASEGSYASSTGIWTIGTLSASSTATLTIAAQVNTGTAGSTITNTATASESTSTIDTNTANNSSSVSVAVQTLPTGCSATTTDQTFVSDTTNLVNGNPAVLVPLPYNSNWTASISGANWIWVTPYVDNPAINESSTFVKTFTVSGTPTSAMLDINADNSYDVFVNGVEVASNSGEFNYFIGNEGHFNVASALHDGTNTISFVVTNFAQPGGTVLTNPAGLLYKLDVQTNGCTSSTPSADLSISKTADVTSTIEGGTVNYTVAVTDNGPATSTGVVATDLLPSGLTLVSATASEGSYASSTGTWTIGNVNASSTATLHIAATANSGTAGSTITNTATVSENASTTDPNTANNSSSVSVGVLSNICTGSNVSASSSVSGTSASSSASATSGCCPANASSSSSNGNANASSSASANGACQNPFADVSIAKTVDNNNPSAGDTVNYTVAVTDLGPATSTGVVASDVLPAGLTFDSATTSEGSYASSTGTWTIGDLSASSTATLTIAATVNSGTEGDTITNTATVSESASTTDSNPANNSSSVSIAVQGGGGGGGTGADIAITKTADVTSTIPGNTVNYTITVNANGPQDSTDVVATDTLPSGLTFENATASVGTYASSTGAWTIGTLNAGSNATLTIAALVNASTTGTITNTATVGESSSLTDTNTGNNSSTVSIPVGVIVPSTDADIAISKTVDNANPAGGDTINFVVTVTDNGPATSTNISAFDQLPLGLAMISATTSQGSYDMGTGDWSNIGTLGPNATATLTYSAAVSGAYAGQAITNTATVSQLSSIVDPNPANNSSTVTVNVQPAACTSNCGGGGGGGGGNTPSAEIGIVKTVDNADPASGSTINYTITVKGAGPSTSFGVVATDVLPAGLTFDSATSSDGSYVSSTGVWTIGSLNNGQSATLTITATVNAADGTMITNTATVKESPVVVDPLSGNNSSSVTIDVGGNGGGGNGGGGGGGGGGGQVLGTSTSTGQVLGASCGLYLTSYIHPDRQNLNDPAQVKKLQIFLNQDLGLSLPVDGIYGASTITAVNQFQVKYHDEVLKPWLPLGLPTEFTPTSYVYQTTQRWINLIMCPPLNLPIPPLKVDNGE